MFDTMTVTKAGGAFCGALLIYLLGSWVAETIYHSGGGHGAHGEEHASAYVIDTGDHGDDAGAAEEGPDFAALLAEADPAKGEKAFAKCKACHKLGDGENGTGPHLFGLVGRAIGGVEGYGYSAALSGLDGTWTPEELDAWLENPAKYAKGTKMTFKTPKIKDRANLVAYLATIGG